MQRFDLKRFRLDRKLTQKELAEILMCKQNYISNGESCRMCQCRIVFGLKQRKY